MDLAARNAAARPAARRRPTAPARAARRRCGPGPDAARTRAAAAGWPSIWACLSAAAARRRPRRRAPPAGLPVSKLEHVAQTARHAGASVGERLDHRVAARGDLAAHVGRRGLGERRLRRALDRVAALGEQALELVEEHVAARLADVQQRDRAAPASARAASGRPAALALGGGIEDLDRSLAPRLDAPGHAAPSLSRPPPTRRRPSRTGPASPPA